MRVADLVGAHDRQITPYLPPNGEAITVSLTRRAPAACGRESGREGGPWTQLWLSLWSPTTQVASRSGASGAVDAATIPPSTARTSSHPIADRSAGSSE